jgi:hypothetical protein
MDSEIRKRFREPLLILFTVAGFLFAYMETNRVSNGAYIPMENVSLPNGHLAVTFELGEYNELHVLTGDGEAFTRWTHGNEGGWVHQDDEHPHAVLCNPYPFDDLPVPKPPGKTIQSIDCYTHGVPDAQTYERFVILSNGDIWHWQLIKGIAEGFAGLATLIIFGLFFTVTGYAFGLAAPFILQRTLRLFRSRFNDTRAVLGLNKSTLSIIVSLLVIVGLIFLLLLTIRGIIRLMVLLL